MLGLDKLVEFILSLGMKALPAIIVWYYEEGVRIGLGFKPKLLKPGLRWKWPFFQEIIKCNVKQDTVRLENVTVTTSDGKVVSIGLTVNFKVIDTILFAVENNDSFANAWDICRSSAAEELSEIEWTAIKKKGTRTTVKNAMKKDCSHLGIEILAVGFSDIAQTRLFTVFKDGLGKVINNSVLN